VGQGTKRGYSWVGSNGWGARIEFAPEAVVAEPTSTESDEEFEAIPRLQMPSEQEIHQLEYRSSTSDREACASNETEAV
jgi:hypothetical protein